MREKRKLFLTIQFQLINIEGMMEIYHLENTIVIISLLGKNQQKNAKSSG